MDIRERGDTIIVASPGLRLVEVHGETFTQPFRGTTYELKDVCGGHYFNAEFKDTVSLENDRFRLISRGGKDIYLAFLKPARPYVPQMPGLRLPLPKALNVDLPAQLDWWWVGCTNGYRVQVANDTAMTQIVADTVVQWVQTAVFNKLEHLKTYYWRVRSNTQDTFSLWSEVRSFTTVKAQPADVILEVPADLTRGVTTSLTLRWTASKRALSYLVDVATDSTFDNKVVNGRIAQTNSLDVTLDNNARYYWRVRASNASGSSPWSNVWSFDVRPGKPTTATLLNPADGSNSELVNPMFVWQGQDTGVVYNLQVARDSAFLFNEFNVNIRETTWRDTLEANTTYFWRVRTFNAYESGDWSTTWSFKTGSAVGINESAENTDIHATYTEGVLSVHLPATLVTATPCRLELFDLAGRSIVNTTVTPSSTPLRLVIPTLARGTYLLTMTPDSGAPVTGRMIVE